MQYRRAGYTNPFSGIDVPWLVATRARTRKDHPFLIWEPFEGPSVELTYGAFHDAVGRLAAGLSQRGIKPGQFVLLHLENCLESILTWYGCAELGAIAVTTNARASGEEVGYFADHCGAVAAVTQPAYAALVNRHCRGLRWMAVTSHDAGVPAVLQHRPDRFSSFEWLLADAADRPQRRPDPLWPVCVQYTSGTTCRPKGVLWTHANALWGGKTSAAHEDLRPGDIHLVYLPLFHANAQSYSILATLWAGGTAVLQPEFSASRFWTVAAKYRCTWTSMVSFCLRALADRDAPRVHTFRLWGNAVSEPPTDSRFGVKTIGWWGMTETVSHGIVGDVNLPNLPNTIGRAAPEYEIAIQADDGQGIAPCETGHLLIRGVPGVSLFKEYLNDPVATAHCFDEQGFFRTGDRVTLLEDGFIKFADRSKDMLKVGGENVAASEVERIILTVPGVREVAVVGKPHRMLDEVPIAFVIPQPSPPAHLEDSIVVACRAKLAKFKVPNEVHLVDELPRSTLGKVAKASLRRRFDAN